ncbi:hypothetical protein ACJMK2_007810 [Sinanodonta woodiana]|uniref:Uncharacterized protein n=1 Tax=Sinanodonta woodiana TaxID=1069815 RepID=A0ABD3VJL9_SINWO
MCSLLCLLAVISVAMSMSTLPPDAEIDLEGGVGSMVSMMHTLGQSGRGTMGQGRNMMGGLRGLISGGGNPLRSLFVLKSENENLHEWASIDCLNNPYTATGQTDPFCMMLQLRH